jgi:DsbC/DsbD-like thiol-disulfide interchange protein
LEVFAYSSEVLPFAGVEAPQNLPNGPIEIQAKSDWLVCEKFCIPGYRASFSTIDGTQCFDRVHQWCHSGSRSEVESLQQRSRIAAQLRIAVRDQSKEIEICGKQTASASPLITSTNDANMKS